MTKPAEEEYTACAQMPKEDAGIRQTAGLLRNGTLTFTGQAVRIYARSHFVLLAQNSESAYVSAASPAGNLVCGAHEGEGVWKTCTSTAGVR